MTFRPPITDEATWEFIRTRIAREKQRGKRYTMYFAVTVEGGEVQDVALMNISLKSEKVEQIVDRGVSRSHNSE